MTSVKACLLLVGLFLVGTWSTAMPAALDEPTVVLRNGTADRVVIDAPPATLSADEVVQFTAIIYDPVNNVLSGDVSWSVSNGTITDDGLFYPWSATVVEVVAEHNGLVDRPNITVEAGVATALEITPVSVGVLEPPP